MKPTPTPGPGFLILVLGILGCGRPPQLEREVGVVLQEVVAQPLAASWSFCEDGGTTSADGTRNSNTGTLSAGASFTASGFQGRGLSLNAANGACKFSVPDSPSLRPGVALTVEAWINPISLDPGTGRSEIVRKTPAAQTSYDLWLFTVNATTATVAFTQHDVDGGSFDLDASSYTIPNCPLNRLTLISGWHLVAATCDGATTRIYIDGVEVCSRSTPIATRFYDSSDVCLGMGVPFGSARFEGTLDEVRIYSGAASATEILADFNGTANRTTRMSLAVPAALAAGARGTITATAYDGCGAIDNTFTSSVSLVSFPAGGVVTPGSRAADAGVASFEFSALTPGTYTVTATSRPHTSSGVIVVFPSSGPDGGPSADGGLDAGSPGDGGSTQGHALVVACGCGTMPLDFGWGALALFCVWARSRSGN